MRGECRILTRSGKVNYVATPDGRMTGMIPVNLIEEIMSSYFGTPHGMRLEIVSEGLTNFNFRLTGESGKMYFLKIFRTANLRRIEGIVRLVEILKKSRFPTPGIIPTKEGKPYWTNQEKSAIMTEYIKGRYPEKSPGELYQIGNVLGALHQIPHGDSLDFGYPLNYGNQYEILRTSGEFIENDLQDLIGRTSDCVERIRSLKFPSSIIHGDLFLDNLLMTEFGDIYFIDFEGGCVEASLFDLSRGVIGCAILHNKIDERLARSLVSGYDLIRNLTDLERESLFDYVVYAGVVSTIWRYNQFNILRKHENRGHMYRALLNPVNHLMDTGRYWFEDSVFGHTDLPPEF